MKLLIIDDDPAICESLKLSLAFHQQDWQIRAAEDGPSGLSLFFEWQPDVVVLDLGLGGVDGADVLRRVRDCSSARVLILSGQGGEGNIAKLLELGADDYVTKPFSAFELVARIRAQARRVDSMWGSRTSSPSFTAGGLSIQFATREVRVDGRRVALTSTEYRLLYHLVQNAGRLMRYESLLQLVWGSEAYGADVVRVYISRLRKKIESGASRVQRIVTKPGLGYVFLTPNDGSSPRAGLEPAGTASPS
jgi:two-component system, OmpR family, KDP operon response regulator KdpE